MHMQLHERMVQQSRWTYNLRSIPHPSLQQIRTFFALSLANTQVGHEARTFFYAHKQFMFCAMPLRVARPTYSSHHPGGSTFAPRETVRREKKRH
jgi:hypothetical protein